MRRQWHAATNKRAKIHTADTHTRDNVLLDGLQASRWGLAAAGTRVQGTFCTTQLAPGVHVRGDALFEITPTGARQRSTRYTHPSMNTLSATHVLTVSRTARCAGANLMQVGLLWLHASNQPSCEQLTAPCQQTAACKQASTGNR